MLKIQIVNNLRSSKGFTLLEMLIVLSVTSIVLLFSIFTYQSFADMLQKKLFITQLEADLYYAHAYAVNRKIGVQIQFSPIKKEYIVRDMRTTNTLFLREFPTTISIEESNIGSFVINPEGNVSNFGKVIFRQNQETFQLTFYIGKGRFFIE